MILYGRARRTTTWFKLPLLDSLRQDVLAEAEITGDLMEAVSS